MKKIISLLFLLTLCIGAYAQKSYIHICAYSFDKAGGQNIFLSGDIPSGISKNYSENKNTMFIGDLLNLLSDQGFEVEFMSGTDYNRMCYILSKKRSDKPSSIRTEEAEDDTDVYEVGRYNLQGLPISKNEKGVQIIVYSNYTTKTIIKE